MTAKFDMSEVRAFAASLDGAAKMTPREARRIVERGANNIKRQLREEMGRSRHFKQIVPTINYDLIDGSGDVGAITAEIGPNPYFRAARLENIAYFGTSRGGGTVPDPRGALDAEIPGFEKAVADFGQDAI